MPLSVELAAALYGMALTSSACGVPEPAATCSRGDVPERRAERVGDVDVAVARDLEVVEEAAAAGLELRDLRLGGDVVDGDRAGGAARDVELAALDLQADGRLAGGAGDVRRDGVAAERAAVDGAVGGDADEERLRALVERDALGIPRGIGLERERARLRAALVVMTLVRRRDGRADRQGEHGQNRDECPLHVDRTS